RRPLARYAALGGWAARDRPPHKRASSRAWPPGCDRRGESSGLGRRDVVHEHWAGSIWPDLPRRGALRDRGPAVGPARGPSGRVGIDTIAGLNSPLTNAYLIGT